MSDYDVIVLGGGAPVERRAAARAARGLRVALVERELVGGECSYWGVFRPSHCCGPARQRTARRTPAFGH